MYQRCKKVGGFCDYRSYGDIQMVRWNDNCIVTLRTNASGVDPVRQVERWQKKKSLVLISHVVTHYNK